MRRNLFFPIFLVCWACLLGTSPRAQAQSDAFKAWVQEWSERPLLRPIERVYLHTDKPYYAVGDDIWFKGYVTIGQHPLLSAFSQILYVELLDSRDSLIQSLRLPIVSGIALGDFHLPDSLAEGNYRLRSYTQWMRNFGSESFFDKIIPIGNTHPANILVESHFVPKPNAQGWQAELLLTNVSGTAIPARKVDYTLSFPGMRPRYGQAVSDMLGAFKLDLPADKIKGPNGGHLTLQIHQEQSQALRKQVPIQSTEGMPTIGFYPESGYMIAGYANKIGIKALASSGKGIGAKGAILNHKGEEILVFETEHAGMGAFQFLPQANEKYKARVTFANGIEQLFDLPPVKSSGYALQINPISQPNVFIQAYISPDLVQEQSLYLLVQQQGAVAYASQFKVNKPEQTFSVPRAQLSPGVYQVTLLGENWKPLAERMFFHYHNDYQLPIVVDIPKDTYKAREKVEVSITVGNTQDTSRYAVLSASVIDLDQVPLEGIYEKGIQDMLLIHPEIRGYLEDPTYYFDNFNAQKMLQLDHLMLTQAWRKLALDLEAKHEPPLEWEAEEAIRFSGMVYEKNGRTPAQNAKVSLFQLNSDQGIILETTTDEKGRFSFDRLVFSDAQRFFIQAEAEDGKRNVVLEIHQKEGMDIQTSKYAPEVEVNIHKQFSTYLKHQEERFQDLADQGLYERSIMLETVDVRSHKKEQKVTRSANLNGPGVADQVLVAEQLSNCVNLVDCLNGRLAGVRFEGSIPYSTRGGGTMLVIVDGIQQTGDGFSLLDGLSVLEVESVEVLRNIGTTAIYGPKGANGVLIVTTKIGGKVGVSAMAPNTVIHRSNGYHHIRTFFAPNYEIAQESHSQKDLRNTIHWEPNIVTNQEGKASFSFYTADRTGLYRILIEGMDTEGRMVRYIRHLQVE